MQLRWLITQNAFTTDELRKFREDNYMSFSDTKKYLANRTEPMLQYMAVNGEWHDVPTVVEYRNQESKNDNAFTPS